MKCTFKWDIGVLQGYVGVLEGNMGAIKGS